MNIFSVFPLLLLEWHKHCFTERQCFMHDHRRHKASLALSEFSFKMSKDVKFVVSQRRTQSFFLESEAPLDDDILPYFLQDVAQLLGVQKLKNQLLGWFARLLEFWFCFVPRAVTVRRGCRLSGVGCREYFFNSNSVLFYSAWNCSYLCNADV